jgi:hypothetical protein
MDHEAARGRSQLLGIAAAVYGPPLVTALLGFGTRPLLAGIFPAVCLVGLVRGWEWARTWTQVTLGLGAIGASIGIVVADTTAHRIASVMTALSWGLGYAALTKSPEIEAYIEHRQAQRDAGN